MSRKDTRLLFNELKKFYRRWSDKDKGFILGCMKQFKHRLLSEEQLNVLKTINRRLENNE